ncbi:hypothetical protein D3C71_2008660 [compost metagenome]
MGFTGATAAFLRARTPAAFFGAAGVLVVFFVAGAGFLAGLRVAMLASVPGARRRVEPYRGCRILAWRAGMFLRGKLGSGSRQP